MDSICGSTKPNDDRIKRGWINGFIGVVIFSGSLPATRIAVMEFDPVFLTVARATLAGLLAACALWFFRERRPVRNQLLSLLIVAIGVVVGFPLLTALALQHVTSAHSIVFLGMLPLATAVFGVLRGGERPRPAFWLFSVLGCSLVVAYAIAQGLRASLQGDALMLCAVCCVGVRPGLRRRRETLADLGGVASHLMGAGVVITADGHAQWFLCSTFVRWDQPAGMVKPGLRLGVQHADRFRILVPRACSGRHCGGRSTPVIATLFRFGARRLLAA